MIGGLLSLLSNGAQDIYLSHNNINNININMLLPMTNDTIQISRHNNICLITLVHLQNNNEVAQCVNCNYAFKYRFLKQFIQKNNYCPYCKGPNPETTFVCGKALII